MHLFRTCADHRPPFPAILLLLGLLTLSTSAAFAASVSGYITNAAGFPVPNVTVELSGYSWNETTTNSAGFYSFNLANNQDYEVTPSRPGYAFTPASQSIFSSGSQTADFQGSPTKPSDFDGDRKTDIAVFHRGAGTPGLADWNFLGSSAGSGSVQWGLSTDTPVPGDYEGDGFTRPAIVRAGGGSNFIWWICETSDCASYETYEFGFNTDIPVPRDYNGDGKVDVATVRPGTGNLVWYLWDETIDDYCAVYWGLSTDKLVPADYDGDGKAEVAVFRPSNGTWYILNQDCPAQTPPPSPDYQAISWGWSTDKPVPGDYDGDGKYDVAVFRPSDTTWYIRKTSDSNLLTFTWGLSTDTPVPGDYDGDDKFDIAVFRPSNSTWYILKSSNGYDQNAYTAQQFGSSNDTPVPSLYIP